MERILISSCLLGLRTRFDGQDCYDLRVKDLGKKYWLIPFCPEIMGGMCIPREPASFSKNDGRDFIERDGNIVLESGKSVSGFFLAGALMSLAFARISKLKYVILKEGSPSCGVFFTNSGFKKINGIGVTAYLLKKNGFIINTIESFLKENRIYGKTKD